MLSACTGIGKNPYVVNVITFSGHSFRFDGDTIFVVPETEVGRDHKVARFINVSALSRKFASTKNILSIFIMNTSNIRYNFKDVPMEGSEEISPYLHLYNDALSKESCDGFLKNGYSIILHAANVGEMVQEG